MTEDQIKHMVNRFLAWRLPKDFRPDAGISYTRPNYAPTVDATPSGTNLLDAAQAEAMVRHMIEGMPATETAALIESFEKILGPFDAETLDDLRHMFPNGLYKEGGTLTSNPVSQVFFRAGLLACREYMARFVEQGGNPEIAQSIRANWWPSLGDDPGAPRLFSFDELCDERDGPDGKPIWTQKEISPSVEALAPADQFLRLRASAS